MSIDLPQIVEKARGASGPLYLATVVDTEGPSYRRTGARLLVGAAGRLAGSVSGGCLERDLVKRIEWLTGDGPRVMTFDTAADGDEEERAYLGCGGTIHVLVERLDSRTLELLAWAAGRSGPCAMVTVVESDCPGVQLGDKHGASGDADDAAGPPWSQVCGALVRECLASRAHLHREVVYAGGRVRVLVEYVPPPRRLLVAGRHYDAGPMVRLAMEAGWHVCVAAERTQDDLGTPDERIALTAEALRGWLEANPRGAMVIMTHSIPLDRLCIETALAADTLPYVAVLGPVVRTRKLLAAIAEEGRELPERAVAQLRSPAGIALGGEGAAAVALSVVGELEQLFGQRIPKM